MGLVALFALGLAVQLVMANIASHGPDLFGYMSQHEEVGSFKGKHMLCGGFWEVCEGGPNVS